MKRRLIVIGIDGGTWRVFDRMIEDRLMPTLCMAKGKGLWSVCNSVHPPVSPSAWASFMTGKNPGKHGVFDFQYYDRNSDSLHFVNSTHIRCKTIWEILSEVGKKICILNIPITYPPINVNGIMVSGFDMPSINSNFTYPASFREEVLSNIPNYRFYLGQEDFFDIEVLCNQVVEAMEHNLKLSLMCIERESWDLFMINIQSIDWLQHRAWNILENVLQDKSNKRDKQLIGSCYKKLDDILAILINILHKKKMDIMFVSDHGFGPSIGQVFLNRILAEGGIICPEEASNNNKGYSSFIKDSLYNFPFLGSKLKELRELYWHVKNFKPNKPFVENLVKQSGRVNYFKDHQYEWACILAYTYGFIYRNSDYPVKKVDDIQVIELFCKVRDPISGQPLFRSVARGAELYPTDSHDLSHIPDIVVIPQPWLKLSPDMSRNVIAEWSIPVKGEHYSDGIFLFLPADKNTKAGKQSDVSLMDIMPTIMSLYGIPVPYGIDGRAIPWITDSVEYQKKNETLCKQEKRVIHHLDDAEANELRKRLSDLGYL